MHDEIEANYSFTLILLNKNIDYLCSNLHTHASYVVMSLYVSVDISRSWRGVLDFDFCGIAVMSLDVLKIFISLAVSKINMEKSERKSDLKLLTQM